MSIKTDNYIGEVYEGEPPADLLRRVKWMRLLVRQNPTPEDREAESLFRELAGALKDSDYGDEYVLSIFRIGPEREASFGTLPKIKVYPERAGIEAIKQYLLPYIREVQIPFRSGVPLKTSSRAI